MPALWESLLAVGIGIGIAVAFIGLLALTFWLAGRRVDREWSKGRHEIEQHPGEQPWNMV